MEKRSHQYLNLVEPGIELGTLWSEGRDLINCANHVCIPFADWYSVNLAKVSIPFWKIKHKTLKKLREGLRMNTRNINFKLVWKTWKFPCVSVFWSISSPNHLSVYRLINDIFQFNVQKIILTHIQWFVHYNKTIIDDSNIFIKALLIVLY